MKLNDLWKYLSFFDKLRNNQLDAKDLSLLGLHGDFMILDHKYM